MQYIERFNNIITIIRFALIIGFSLFLLYINHSDALSSDESEKAVPAFQNEVLNSNNTSSIIPDLFSERE